MTLRKTLFFLLVALLYTVNPHASFAQEAKDNPSVTGQLNDMKLLVVKIKKDATEMETFTRQNGPSWQTHVAALTRIKGDVNKLQESTRGLQSHRTIASPWQQDAIDRVTALANNLATNMNNAIDQLNKSKARPAASPYADYLKANTRIATDLAEEIDGIIDYGQAKAKMDELEKQLPQ
jgi:wobble nucleotide-excising tRNase